MVKTDDYLDGSSITASFETRNLQQLIKEDINDNVVHNANWMTPRSKSAGLAEYESDEGGQLMANSKIIGESLDDRRLRRQIANCNERRRMQSINAGFHALRQLLPCKDGDKMSKASILSATAEFIQTLLFERSKLLEENARAAKRRRLDFGEQNGATTLDEIPANLIECIKTVDELRVLLEKEKQLRMNYEKELIELRRLCSTRQGVCSLLFPLDNSGDSESFTGSNIILPNEIPIMQQLHETNVSFPYHTSNQLINSSASRLENDGFISATLLSSLAKVAPSTSTCAAAIMAQQALVNAATTAVVSSNQQIGINDKIAAEFHMNSVQTLSNAILPSPMSKNCVESANNTSSCSDTSVIFNQHKDKHYHNSPKSASVYDCNGGDGLNAKISVSQQNLQALVLAIHHLEGAK